MVGPQQHCVGNTENTGLKRGTREKEQELSAPLSKTSTCVVDFGFAWTDVPWLLERFLELSSTENPEHDLAPCERITDTDKHANTQTRKHTHTHRQTHTRTQTHTHTHKLWQSHDKTMKYYHHLDLALSKPHTHI